MNNSVCLRLSIIELSKISICEFRYGYVKQKYGEKAKFVIEIQIVSLYT